MFNFKYRFKLFITLGLSVLLLGLAGQPLAVQASSVVFNSHLAVTVGQTFTVPLHLKAGTEKNYTADLDLTFPANILEITSFSLAKSWLALAQTGYDLEDNVNGRLIKTGGFPTGFSGSELFGTITFRAIRAGTGAVVLDTKSFILNAKNANTLESWPRLSVTVGNSTPPPVVSASTSSPRQLTAPTPVATSAPQLAATPTPYLFDVQVGPGPAEAQANQTPWTISLIAIIVILLLIYFIRKKRSRKN